ncbi:hypothetical protein P775_17700 [Puniceibacterium antarcticum]|uniref:PPC domain-containing protein n=1 Tax=Puniceibacterium antarcticum TaxID=1206336 RepID=A0A2G8RBF7_9RHOB|nr:hypothetical protein [Puniceibacterium antarcticum]PIL18877.1 hypothetical protein P775_17700 [Puniceibacterium antarcticum]
MSELRQITHPGPVATDRISAVPCRVTRKKVTLSAGVPLLQAMTAAVDGAAAWFDLSDLTVAKLSFVRPAPAPGDGHVAWYSAMTTLYDARIIRAGVHLGRRDGAPFAHVHGIWADRDGALHMGHLFSEDTVLDHAVNVDVLLITGAHLESAQDSETQFLLFRPVKTSEIAGPNAVLAIARPNAVIDDALVAIAGQAGLESAAIHGIGSLIGTEFATGDGISSYATEVLLTKGRLTQSGVALEAACVGFDGPYAEGPLARSRNTICVTFELLLVGDQSGAFCEGHRADAPKSA